MNQGGYALALVKDVMLLPLAGYYLWNPLSWKDNKNENESVPILLIHGSGFNQSEWIIGRKHLMKKDCDKETKTESQRDCDVVMKTEFQHSSNDTTRNVYSFDWDTSNESDIEHYTSHLEKKINEILETRPNRDIILIGHSMGGLMAGYYTEYIAKSARVNVLKVITIATPWQGTSALEPFVKIRSFLGLNEMAKRYQQMLPNSLFLRELNEMIRDSTVPYMTIGSYHDLMVPYPSCHLESARSKTTLWGLGHYSIIISSTLWKHVCSDLN